MVVETNAKQAASLMKARNWMVSVATLALSVGTAFAYPLERVSMENTKGGDTILTLKTSEAGDVQYEIFCLGDPYRLVVDVEGADAPVAVKSIPDGFVEEIRTSIWKDDASGRTVRYVIETSGPLAYEAKTESGDLSIRLIEVPKVVPTPSIPELPAVAMEAPLLGDAAEVELTVAQPEEVEPEVETVAELSKPLVPVAKAVPAYEPQPDTIFPVSAEFLDNAGEAAARADADFRSSQAHAGVVNQPPMGSAQGIPALGQDAAPSLGGGVDASGVHAPSAFGNANGAVAGASLMQTSAKMNLDVQNGDVRTVFRSIAAFANVNIVPDRDVSGPVSIKLTQTPWRQALEIVSESASLTVIDGEGVYRVATQRTFQQELVDREQNARKREQYLPLQTHIFQTGYASSGDLVPSVKLVLSERGTVAHDPRTNSLIVTDIESRVTEIGSLVRTLDSETRQVEIVAQIVDMDVSSVARIGVDWDLENLGDSGEGLSIAGGVSAGLNNASGQIRFGLIRSWGDLDATLQAFAQENNANIISNPKITTVNNHPASILVGKEIPLITLDESGNPITELKKVGITLRVTPYINNKGRITMDLHPEISDLSSQATVQGGLIFNTTEAKTRIMVGNGETAVIGGLIRTNETEFEQGVPILRSIPFLGRLFKTTDTVIEKRELLIFVTPRVVEPLASNG